MTVAKSSYEPVCILTQFSNTFLDITFEVSDDAGDVTLGVKKTNLLNYYSDFQPVYIDFEEDIVVVKGRSATAEAMLFYVRNPALTSDLYWGLNPEEYYEEFVEGETTTPCIPVTAVTFDTDKKTMIRIT